MGFYEDLDRHVEEREEKRHSGSLGANPRLTKALTSSKSRVDRKQDSQASLFRYDPEMERAAKLKETDPAYFETLGAGTKTALGYYLSAKAAAEAKGIDTSGAA